MVSTRIKEKNIKDLEYNSLLNKQNIILILIGTAIISISLNKIQLFGLPKFWTISILFLLGLIGITYFSNRLEEKANEIRNL